MSKMDTRHKSPAEGKASALVPWDELPAPERELLARVEAEVIDPPASPEEVPTAPSRWAMAWGWGLIGALGVLCVVGFFLWPTTPSIPALQAEGLLKLQPGPNNQKTIVRLEEGARLRDPQGWSLRSHGRSELQVLRKSARGAQLQLHRGAVIIHMTPGSMKRFVVACAGGIQVVVKGTKFLVWQGKAHVRVEVQRGHVLLRRGKQPLLHLYKGQGARLQPKESGPMKMYQLPSKASDWSAKLAALALRQPNELQAYVKDILAGKLLTRKQRMLALETAAHAFEGARRWRAASRIWWRLYKLRPSGFEAQTALFQAARSCRLGAPQARRCVRLYQQFLRRFPKSITSFREEAMFWAAARPNAETSTARLTSRRLLQAYLRQFPTGRYTKEAARLLAMPAP